MQTQILNSLRIPLKPKKMNSLEKSKYLNLPDLQFFNWCNQQYGLNKGVYNTIDNWLYENGLVSIQYRRIYLLAFLEYVKDVGLKQEEHKFIRFGSGGLTRMLQNFTQQVFKESMIHLH